MDVANIRMATSNEAGWNHASTYSRSYSERLQQEVVGACGEIALCKVMNWYWSPSVNTFHSVADVGANVEVRSSARADGSLIIRGNDADDRWYVGVFGEPPFLYVAGFIHGSQAKRDEWVRDPNGMRPAWFVPQSALQPIPAQNNS